MRIQINTDNLPNEIVFCRHGESIGNALGLDDNSIAGIANHRFELTAKGVQQATEARGFLRDFGLNRFAERYVSTYARTQSTFQTMFPKDIVPYEDPRLNEWWKGVFHSLTPEQMQWHYPIEREILRREGWYHYRPPQGEAGVDVELRILSFLSNLTPVSRIFICGHGSWYLFFERLLLGLSRTAMSTVVPKNCSLTHFVQSDGVFRKSLVFVPSC